MNTAKLFVISAPSGGGKTSIVKAILQKHPEILFSVSATTRTQRPGEIHGKDYFFLTKEKFEELLHNKQLVEYEQLFGDYYGTLKEETDRALSSNKIMMFDVDVRGALSIKKFYGNDAVLIFIAPPDMKILEERLRNRKTESEEKIKTRIERAGMELEIGKQFDYTVVNNNLESATKEVENIIQKHLL